MVGMNREELIAQIDKATVPETLWHDRDSAGAQRQLGEARALLLAECEFAIEDDGGEDYIHANITYKGFNYFEVGEMETDWLYVPTDKRLAERVGEDWY